MMQLLQEIQSVERHILNIELFTNLGTIFLGRNQSHDHRTQREVLNYIRAYKQEAITENVTTEQYIIQDAKGLRCGHLTCNCTAFLKEEIISKQDVHFIRKPFLKESISAGRQRNLKEDCINTSKGYFVVFPAKYTPERGL